MVMVYWLQIKEKSIKDISNFSDYKGANGDYEAGGCDKGW